jgi:serine/threonine protein kinase
MNNVMSKLKLYDTNGSPLFQVDLAREIDRGGEGSILPHPKDNTQVLKIYHDGITPNLTQQTWTYLNQLDKRFIKPLELFYNDAGVIIGFSMNLLDKSFFRIAQIFTKSQCAKLGISETIKGKISKELVSVIEEAHSKNIVIGDFNPYNIFINPNGDIQILDVDSFETPALKHSGRQLDEIRDHYFLGKVSRESDYFALAVNIFRLFTYVHPYKGVHKTWKQLEERAIKRISVLSNDADLIIPAFYEPIANKALELQFKRIFNDGERFLIQVDHVSAAKKQVIVLQTNRKNIIVKTIANAVLDLYFNETVGYIKTAFSTELYDCTFVGNLTSTGKINNADYDYLWIGNKNIIRVKNNKLYQQNEPIINFEFPENFRFIQIDHVVFGVDWENIYHLYPDKIINRNVSWNKVPSWGCGFKFENSPIQLTGGVARTHYRNGDTFNAVKLPLNAKSLNLKGNIGVITYVENEKLKHQWCCINGLNFELCKETEEIFSFAVKQSADNAFVFVPKDGTIEILRTPDFSVVDSIDFEECTAQSQLFLTRSGLLLLENQVLYLINRK